MLTISQSKWANDLTFFSRQTLSNIYLRRLSFFASIRNMHVHSIVEALRIMILWVESCILQEVLLEI